MTIEVKNDEMLGKTNNNTLHIELMKLQQENKQLKERLERIDNYLNKNYTAENQYWFDHIRDIVEDR